MCGTTQNIPKTAPIKAPMKSAIMPRIACHQPFFPAIACVRHREITSITLQSVCIR